MWLQEMIFCDDYIRKRWARKDVIERIEVFSEYVSVEMKLSYDEIIDIDKRCDGFSWESERLHTNIV